MATALPAALPPPGSYLNRLHRSIKLFRQIASLKAVRGEFAEDGSILIDAKADFADLVAAAQVNDDADDQGGGDSDAGKRL